jgi:hypothetical protein
MSNENKNCPICKNEQLLVEMYTTTKCAYYRVVCYKSCRKGDWRKSTLRAYKAWNDRLYSNTEEPGIN